MPLSGRAKYGVSLVALIVAFLAGFVVGRGHPIHRYEPFVTKYVLDTATGSVCNPFPAITTPKSPETAITPMLDPQDPQRVARAVPLDLVNEYEKQGIVPAVKLYDKNGVAQWVPQAQESEYFKQGLSLSPPIPPLRQRMMTELKTLFGFGLQFSSEAPGTDPSKIPSCSK